MDYILHFLIGFIIVGVVAMLAGQDPRGWMLECAPILLILLYAKSHYQAYKREKGN